MKLLNVFIVLVLLQNCSFDNKTGIWKNEKNFSKKGYPLLRCVKWNFLITKYVYKDKKTDL